MRFIRLIALLFTFFYLSHCSYKSYVFLANIDKKQKRIYFTVPSKFIVRKSFYGETLKSIGVLYGDSSIIYISQGNSKFLPNYYIVENLISQGYNRKKDTTAITYSGVDKDKVWKEVIYKGQIWLGYKDVPLEIQAKFDKSLTKSLPKAQKK